MEPDYKAIFTDIIESRYPHKQEKCEKILEKQNLSVLDVILLDKLIFGISDKELSRTNQKHRAYSQSTILEILSYGQIHKCNNTQLATHFKLSRNTITKWKKIFLKVSSNE